MQAVVQPSLATGMVDEDQIVRLGDAERDVLFAAASVILPAAPDTIRFTDVQKQTRQFMGWYETIKLTPEQDAVKKEALGAIPAPCCNNNLTTSLYPFSAA